MQSGFEAVPIVVVEDIAVALMIRFMGVIGIENGVRKTAGISDNGNGAVFEADELGQAAGFVFAGNKDHVRAGVNEVGQFFVVTDFEMTIGVIIESPFEVQKGGVDMAVRTGTEENKLAAAVQAIWDSVKNQLDPFLMVQSADKGNDGTELFPQPHTIPKGFFVGVFVIDGLD